MGNENLILNHIQIPMEILGKTSVISSYQKWTESLFPKIRPKKGNLLIILQY